MTSTDKYKILIDSFVSGRCEANEFESQYLALFKGEKDLIDESLYCELNRLFSDVDAYCGDIGLRDSDDIDEKQLLESAKRTLMAISLT